MGPVSSWCICWWICGGGGWGSNVWSRVWNRRWSICWRIWRSTRGGHAGAPGVYVAGEKVAALGLRVRRGATYHGLSLNVDMDLEPFTRHRSLRLPGSQSHATAYARRPPVAGRGAARPGGAAVRVARRAGGAVARRRRRLNRARDGAGTAGHTAHAGGARTAAAGGGRSVDPGGGVRGVPYRSARV